MITDFAKALGPDHITVFLFHGVIEENRSRVRNYTGKHLTRAEFEAFLQTCLDAGGMPVSLDDLIAHVHDGAALPERAFAVTFDDGFRNNLTVAAPILRRLGIPATVYITSDFVDSNRMSWIDRIEYAVDAKSDVALSLPWGERAASDTAGKRALLDDIRKHVKSDPDMDADGLASDIQRQLGLPETWSSDDPLDRKLNWDEVRELSAVPGVTIGGHTHTHRILSYLSDAEIREEVRLSLSMLRDRAGIETVHYSYPEGQEEHYDDRVIRILKEHGIRCCPSAIDGTNSGTPDLFHLRRIMVQEAMPGV